MAKKPTEAEVTETAPAEEKKPKSIVPARYASRYKNGGNDVLAEFIKAQCNTKEGFGFPAFFQLCRANGLPEDKVAHYEGQVAENRHGAQGRARMTLRNMLATIVRKDGKLVGNDGAVAELSLPKPTLSGAAAKAKENAATEQTGAY
jgi:hypothetical protein